MNTKKSEKLAGLTDIILESISDGVFTVDHHWKITSFNRAAEEITGIDRDEAIGSYCWDVFRSNMCERDCALKRTMSEGKALTNSSTYIVTGEKKRTPIFVSTSLLKDENGSILGGVEIFRDLSLIEELRKDLSKGFEIGDMVSRSKRMQELFRILDPVAQSESTVLITGETGTGKELMARAIHDLSSRKQQPFIALNCGALPDSLLESELFGYKAGAFTDARKDKPGLFAAADRGTILLDEIGDTSSAFQVRLLRVLEDRTFLPLGGHEPIRTNIRVIASTNKNLTDLVDNGDFRQDLFYRINVITLALPSLRERKEDIPLLVDRFIAHLNRKKGRQVDGISPEAIGQLIEHDFPGNIRELENSIEHAFILCGHGPIDVDHLPVSLKPQFKRQDSFESSDSIQARLAATERDTILKALEQADNNRTAAAAALGMHKSTLFRKIKKLNIPLPAQDGRHTSHSPSR